MKHKAKRFKEGGGYGRFTEEKLDVEGKKEGLFAGKAAEADDDTDDSRPKRYTTTPEKKKAPAKPKTKTGSGASGFPLKEDDPINISSGASGFGLKEKEKDPDYATGKKKIEGTPGKDSEKKYGIGPHGAFGGIEKAIREFKTPADRRYEEKTSKKMASGGKVSSASSRGDGIAQRGKTRGRMC
jgi:hypothetical protein